MAGIIGHILPLALGVALSSVPIVVMVLILLSPRGRLSSLTYLIGAVIGLAGLTTLFTAVATLLPPAPSSTKSPLVATIELALGVGLLIIAGVRWRGARRRHEAATHPATTSGIGSPAATGPAGTAAPEGATAGAAAPAATGTAGSQTGAAKWMAKVTTLGPVPSLGLGFVLMLRPKNLLLTIAAGVAIGAGGATFSEVVVGIALFVVLGISTLAAPIIFAVVDPARMRRPLEETRIWIESNSATVTTIVVLVLGTVIIGSGLAHY